MQKFKKKDQLNFQYLMERIVNLIYDICISFLSRKLHSATSYLSPITSKTKYEKNPRYVYFMIHFIVNFLSL